MRTLDDIISQLRDRADSAWMRGDCNTYTLLVDARSKLLEARGLVEILVHDLSDNICYSIENKGTNFLAGAVHHE